MSVMVRQMSLLACRIYRGGPAPGSLLLQVTGDELEKQVLCLKDSHCSAQGYPGICPSAVSISWGRSGRNKTIY